MSLILTIENADRLADGGPLRVEVTARGLDIGRDRHLDWTLPDPTRHVSGKHCEVRYTDGGYWLHDVSTNGTFVNGAEFRLEAPHRLRNGDRLAIGHYLIAVAITGEPDAAGVGAPGAGAAGFASVDDPWGSEGAAPPVDRREIVDPRRPQRPGSDFLDWAVGIPVTSGPSDTPPVPTPRTPPPDEDWLRPPAPPQLAEPAPPPPMPVPRRPVMAQPEAVAPVESAIAIPDPPPPPERPAPRDPIPAPPLTPPLTPALPAAAPSDTIRRIARAAGIPDEVLARRDADQLADEIGDVLRLMVLNLSQLLATRSETKSLMRSSNRTMIAARENNPLKFSATPDEALRLMFGPPTGHYTDAKTTVSNSFGDIKAHQIQTFSAMQSALQALFEDLAPEQIEKAAEPDRGLSGLVGSRKAKLWDTYVERWKAKTARQDGRLTDAFMLLFAESYDRLQQRGPSNR